MNPPGRGFRDAPLTLGTAGHIDHGKTALIRALTGTDTDRLPQERARGISIELGYAALELPSGRRLSVIDAPGHERFVRTMVAGATGIDLFLMTIAADDGVMPQTREHAAVLDALGVRVGVVAITKSDLADPGPAAGAARELLPGAEVVAVSARTGARLDDLRAALDAAASGLPSRADAGGPARLHIDRAFTIRGAGTVVTGTLWSGPVGRGDQVRLLPGGLRARVRGVQVHDEGVERALAGQRVAVNLTGVRVADVTRGDVVVAEGADLRPAYRVEATLSFPGEREPEHGERVQVHHGTRESPARLSRLEGDRWRLRLEQPLIAAPGDRLVVRQIAPPDTLGGGVVVDGGNHRRGTRLRDSHAAGPPPSLPQPEPLSSSALELEQRLLAAGVEPPSDAELDPRDLRSLREAGRAVRVSRTLHYHPEVLDQVRRRVIELGSVSLAELRDELQTSRKFAQALLEHFDAERTTIRREDRHVVRRSAR